jgi:hypothetical protein
MRGVANLPLIPAEAGIQEFRCEGVWIPAYAGMSGVGTRSRE